MKDATSSRRFVRFVAELSVAALLACGSEIDEPQAPDPHFATRVTAFSPGTCAGFGKNELPDIVLGPPDGAGNASGGLDVVSLGTGGEIVLSVEPNAIVDGEGADFLVFENPFLVGNDPEKVNANLGEVSVSEDGVLWKTFPCAQTNYPYTGCAGWNPVLSSKTNGISARDAKVAGGDRFDLRDVGLSRARFVRIRDLGTEACSSDPTAQLTTNGFDLDGIAVVHGELK